MQGMIRFGLLAGLLVACHTSDTATPDGPTPDGTPGPPGLHLTWASEPPGYPETLGGGLTVASVAFTVDNLKVIGDAGPGDTRTTKSTFQMRWDSDSAPQNIDFADAPPGLYSKVSLQFDGHLILPSLEIKGQVTVQGTALDFEVEDRNAVSLSLDIDRMLQPGGSASIALKLELQDALTSIDWQSLPIDHGKVRVETGDAQLDDFVAKLTHAFSVDDSDPN